MPLEDNLQTLNNFLELILYFLYDLEMETGWMLNVPIALKFYTCCIKIFTWIFLEIVFVSYW